MEWSEIAQLSPDKLATLLNIENELGWNEADKISLLRNQLQAPMWPDLSQAHGARADELESLIRQRPADETFQDHLLSQKPSVELLLSMKIFAQQIRNEIANPLHGDAAAVIYFAAIAAALARCGTRITSLSDEQLREGFVWTLRHPAATELQPVLTEAVERLSHST